jgi:high-affinity iron transporter
VLLDSVVLVLREVLEAAVLVSVLLALAHNMRLRNDWLWYALALSVLCVLIYSSVLGRLTAALGGAGQEVTNASLQFAVFLLVLPILWLCTAFPQSGQRRLLGALMTLTVTFAIIRECAEIQIYIQAYSAVGDQAAAVWAGSALGAGVGLSAGVLFYAALRALAPAASLRACLVALSLIGAGMVMQATMLLEQVDWLPHQAPLWDSSPFVSEQSFIGELLYAVLGYEATPGPLQVALYGGSLLLALGAVAGGWKWRTSREAIT